MDKVVKTEKSVGVSVVLTFFFNFFGLLYSSMLSFWIIGALYILSLIGVIGWSADAYTQTMEDIAVSSDYTHREAAEAGAAVGAGIAWLFTWFWIHFLSWIVCTIIGVITTQKHNRKVAADKELRAETRHQETLAALGEK